MSSELSVHLLVLQFLLSLDCNRFNYRNICGVCVRGRFLGSWWVWFSLWWVCCFIAVSNSKDGSGFCENFRPDIRMHFRIWVGAVLSLNSVCWYVFIGIQILALNWTSVIVDCRFNCRVKCYITALRLLELLQIKNLSVLVWHWKYAHKFQFLNKFKSKQL